VTLLLDWGHSSVGRAVALQASGLRFDPACLHHFIGGVLMKNMSMEYIVRQIHRLEWAAETTPDYKWRKHHLYDREYFIKLLLEKFSN